MKLSILDQELMVLTISGDYATRLASYELLAGAFGRAAAG